MPATQRALRAANRSTARSALQPALLLAALTDGRRTMGLHPPKPIRKIEERIGTQKPLARLNRKEKSRIHRQASDFRQTYRSGFSKVGVVSSNLIARSRSSPFE